MSPEDMGPLEDQPAPEPKSNVSTFDGVPYRYTPELIIRSLFGHIDRVEDIVVFVTYKGTRNPTLLKSPGIDGSMWLALSAAAYERGVDGLIYRGPASPIPENPE